MGGAASRLVAGIIGQAKFSYDPWGDTVNTAGRLETFGVAGEIDISRVTRDLIADPVQVRAPAAWSISLRQIRYRSIAAA